MVISKAKMLLTAENKNVVKRVQVFLCILQKID